MKAKKHFGQHFLVNQGIIENISNWIKRLATDEVEVIEIGPGQGALTEALLKGGLKVKVIEIDPDMISFLQKKFLNYLDNGHLKIINADALELDWDQLDFQARKKYLICGNLPYNVGTQIVMKYIEKMPWETSFVFMLQKEVIQRLKAEKDSKDYALLSAKIAWMTKMKDYFWVKAGSFQPPPKVESGVIVLVKTDKNLGFQEDCEDDLEYKRLVGYLSKFFQQRRKMLSSVDKSLKAHPWANFRPEQLDPFQLLELYRYVSSNKS